MNTVPWKTKNRGKVTDRQLLENRAKIYALAKQANPNRWSGKTRHWGYVDVVHLNPDTQKTKETKITQKVA